MSIENQSRQPKGPNLIDILLYLLSKWPWYVASLALCLAFAWYHYATAPMVFFAQTKVIIKDPPTRRRPVVLTVTKTPSTALT